MEQLRPVSKLEKILFPIIVTIVVCLILPTTAPLVGMLMLGNLFREMRCGKTADRDRFQRTDVYRSYPAGYFCRSNHKCRSIPEHGYHQDRCPGSDCICIWYSSRCICSVRSCAKLTGGKVNPLIGSAGVSAVPMAARVSQKVGAEADPTNFLLMHAMGPNVAGVIGTAVAAGTFHGDLRSLSRYS